jgi:hypothetical protein
MQCSEHHKKLTNGVGKCSVPMWRGGMPAGFCDEPAYGMRPPCVSIKNGKGEMIRVDGKYSGYAPFLACPAHGGPEKPANDKKENIYKDLGWENGWREYPPEYKKCVELKHRQNDVDIGPPNRGIHHIVTCDTCKIKWHYDSSD